MASSFSSFSYRRQFNTHNTAKQQFGTRGLSEGKGGREERKEEGWGGEGRGKGRGEGREGEGKGMKGEGKDPPLLFGQIEP